MRVLVLVGALAVIPGVAAAQLPPPPSPVSWGVDVAASSAYLWRGMTDIGVPTVQPSFWFDVGPVSVDAWFVGPDPDSSLSLREHDLTVEYTRAAGSFDITTGWAYYYLRYQPLDRHAHEMFVRISREAAITPSLEVARGLTPAGTTVIGSVEGRLPVSRSLDAVGWLSGGYNHHLWIEASLFTHVEGRAAMEWTTSERVAIKPFVGWSRSLDPSVMPSRAYAGVELSIQGRP